MEEQIWWAMDWSRALKQALQMPRYFTFLCSFNSIASKLTPFLTSHIVMSSICSLSHTDIFGLLSGLSRLPLQWAIESGHKEVLGMVWLCKTIIYLCDMTWSPPRLVLLSWDILFLQCWEKKYESQSFLQVRLVDSALCVLLSLGLLFIPDCCWVI